MTSRMMKIQGIAALDLAPTAEPSATRDRRSEGGFTLLELLIVVALIGILACLAIPNMISAMDKGRRNSTMANVRQLSQALDAYAIEHDRYPQVASIDELAAVLEPEFLRKAPRIDGWGNPLIYECRDSGQSFTIVAVGKDGTREARVDGMDPVDDIVCVDGKLLLDAEKKS